MPAFHIELNTIQSQLSFLVSSQAGILFPWSVVAVQSGKQILQKSELSLQNQMKTK